MPELPFCKTDWQACRVEPLCARPADIPLTLALSRKGRGNKGCLSHKGRWDLLALAGSRGCCGGFHGEEFIRGRANAQSDWYWSSTTNANNTDNAWIVNMWNGNVNNDNKDNKNYVWPVRSGEWLPPLFSFENLYRCYLKCRKNKRNTINALRFEMNVEENLFRLSEELQNKTYKPSRSVCFIVERPIMKIQRMEGSA